MIKYFTIPGYWSHFFEIQAILKYHEQHPEYFYTDRIFDSAYDLPPQCIWNGGRANLSINKSLNIDEVYNYYHSLDNFYLRHTCTNMLLDSNTINDPVCNELFNKYYKENEYVIVNNLLLRDHLSNIVPENKFIYSVTIGLKDLDTINTYSRNNLVVLNYTYNNDYEFLKQLLYPQHMELICGELCIDNCPNQSKHYETYSKFNLNIPLDEDESLNCKFRTNNNNINNLKQLVDYYLKTYQHAISNERIEELSNMGIQYFKISGRERPTATFLAFFIYYLVLPDYHETVFNDLCLLTEKLKIKYKLTHH